VSSVLQAEPSPAMLSTSPTCPERCAPGA
jgi:hypothetical protein